MAATGMKKANSDAFDAPASRTSQNISKTGAAVFSNATTDRLSKAAFVGARLHGASSTRLIGMSSTLAINSCPAASTSGL